MTDTKTRTYSERAAAAQLGMNSPTLRHWRVSGWLADDVVTSGPKRPVGVRAAIYYNADVVDAAAAGEREIVRDALEPEPVTVAPARVKAQLGALVPKPPALKAAPVIVADPHTQLDFQLIEPPAPKRGIAE